MQHVFEIRGNSKIHNVTTSGLAHLGRLEVYSLSVNMLQKCLLNLKHYTREKWLDATSAHKVLTGTKILFTGFYFFDFRCWLDLYS